MNAKFRGGHGAFPTTHWSVVLEARSVDVPSARVALEALCRCYWYPLYAFARRQGRDHHEAEDVTQGFFAHLIESRIIEAARPERGRFRTLLLASAKHFFTDEWRRANAQKRPGSHEHVPIEMTCANERFGDEPVDPAFTPEAAFDRNWALTVIERATAELRDEYIAAGRGELYAKLADRLWTERSAPSHADIARQLEMTEHAFTVAVSRLRERLRRRLREQVAATVATEGEIGDELNHLLAAVRLRTNCG